MKILVINGPNLNMLGVREPEIYGSEDYNSLCRHILRACSERGVEAELFQSNHEGLIVDRIQEAFGTCDGIIINPAAYTHTSVALLDALKAVGLPAVEVHLSDPDKREEFRRVSYVREACVGTFSGHGFEGYVMALDFLMDYAGAGR